jgi:MSHA biogenesis protein MshK
MSRFLCAWLLCCGAGAALAQAAPLADPTRPPNAAAASAGEAAARAGPQLQSVLISPARRVAVISGRAVALGDKYGDATVASISESAVLLRYAGRSETLRLIPCVEKRERRAADAPAPDKGPSQ